MQTAAMDRKLNNQQAAEYIGVSPDSLKTWRCTRTICIPFVKIGRRVIYRESDLDRYLTEHTVCAAASG